MALTVILAFFVAAGILWLVVMGMFGPMQYWNPWWGLISVPGVLGITIAIIMAISDWRS